QNRRERFWTAKGWPGGRRAGCPEQYDVRRSIPIRRLQCAAHEPALGQRQPLSGDRRPCDVACQMLELVPLRGLRGDARVQRETGAFGHLPARAIRLARQRLQREHFLPLSWPRVAIRYVIEAPSRLLIGASSAGSNVR